MCMCIWANVGTRFRPCTYDLNFGAADPLTGTANAAINSAVQLLRGMREMGTSFSTTLKPAHSPRDSSKPNRGSRPRDFKVGANRASRAVVSGPINAGVAITQGLHNSPRLWGGRVERKQPCVTDFGSGLKAGGNVCCFLFFFLSSFSTGSCIAAIIRDIDIH